MDIKELISGSCAGISQILIGHPLDTIKIRYIKYNYSNFYNCLKDIKGVSNFYKGVRSPLIGSIFINAQTFSLYNKLRKNHNSFNSGACTGLSLSLIETPIDLIKIRMQIRNNKMSNISYISLIKEIELKRIYTGFGITCIRNYISVGLYFSSYEKLKDNIDNKYFGSFIAGAGSGFCCWGPTYFLDNIKTQIQSDTTYKSNIISVIKNNSFKSLWRGFSPCICRAIIVNPFVFLTYEITKNKFLI